MEEYLTRVLSQIRCTKAIPYIKEEMKAHIEDQTEANMEMGMTRAEAEAFAVKDMGDPVEVGMSLDGIHRPQVAWKMIGLVGFITVISIAFQFLYSVSETAITLGRTGMFPRFVIYTFLGFAMMCLFFYLDYTFLARHAKPLTVLMLAVPILDPFMLYGNYYVLIGPFSISVNTLMMCCIPLFAGILYQYRNKGKHAFFKSCAWMAVLVMYSTYTNLLTGLIVWISCLLQMTLALHKGWYQVNVKMAIAGLWTAFAVIIGLFGGYSWYCYKLGSSYRASRLMLFFSGEWRDRLTYLNDSNADGMIRYIIHNYGIIAGFVVIGVLTLLVVAVFHACFEQKNELGLLMGFGCGLVFFFGIFFNLMFNFGFFPMDYHALPFFSIGGTYQLLCYSLVGIVLSIYRYKDIYPAHHIFTKTQRFIKFTL